MNLSRLTNMGHGLDRLGVPQEWMVHRCQQQQINRLQNPWGMFLAIPKYDLGKEKLGMPWTSSTGDVEAILFWLRFSMHWAVVKPSVYPLFQFCIYWPNIYWLVTISNYDVCYRNLIICLAIELPFTSGFPIIHYGTGHHLRYWWCPQLPARTSSRRSRAQVARRCHAGWRGHRMSCGALGQGMIQNDGGFTSWTMSQLGQLKDGGSTHLTTLYWLIPSWKLNVVKLKDGERWVFDQSFWTRIGTRSVSIPASSYSR